MDESIVLSLSNISKSFPGVKALDSVSIDVARGEVFVLLGENGAGKSTLIKILTGVYQQDGGKVFVDGQEASIRNTHDSRNLGIGTVFQENTLIPHLTVAENIFLTCEIKNKLGIIDWAKMHSECLRWGRELGIEVDPLVKIKTLSVAQQQLVEILKMFSKRPRIVILDEPTSALSDHEVDNLFNVILTMKNKGITFIYISHRLEELKRIGDRGAVLRDGKKVGDLNHVTEMDQNEIIRMIVGRLLTEKFPDRNSNIGDILFEAKNISVPGVLDDVSLNVRRGEVLGLAGLVGSGRTSLAKVIFGALPCGKGSMSMNRKPIQLKSPWDAIKAGIGYLPENRKTEGVILNKPIAWNITLPSIKKYVRFFIKIDAAKEREDVRVFTDKLNIRTPSVYRLTRFLSGGNQQKVVFSKWVCADSKLYIFDEPTRGIDVGTKTDIYLIINQLVAEGNAVIVISSELPEILGICDRIVVMHDGRVSAELAKKDATQEKIMYYAIGGNGNG
jgi:ABC-type sugar transport system ATPase subunit